MTAMKSMESLDPRVKRLPDLEENAVSPKAPLDQLGTFEVFVQPREGKNFQHEGVVHAPGAELAFVLAKEAFTRRFTCSSLYVVATGAVSCSAVTEGNDNAYDTLSEIVETDGPEKTFEIYQLAKRGKQHVHAGTVAARNPHQAMLKARQQFRTDRVVYSVWAIPTDSIRFTVPEEADLWATLPEKKFRDAAAYKGGEKLAQYLEKVKN